MDEFVKAELEDAGVNVDETLRRFMNNEALMVKFLKKFVDDENMKHLRTLIADKKYQEVLPVAHTLKGVCGNLGFVKLYELFSRMCQDCRSEQYENLNDMFAQTEEDYAKVVEAIKKIEESGPGIYSGSFFMCKGI